MALNVALSTARHFGPKGMACRDVESMEHATVRMAGGRVLGLELDLVYMQLDVLI